MENNKKKNWSKFFYWLIFALILIVIYKCFDNVSSISLGIKKFFNVLMPFILGIIVAYLFYLPSKGFENLYKKIKIPKKIARVLSIFTVYAIAVMLIIILINIVFPAISSSVVDLANNMPGYYNSAINYVSNLPENSIIAKEDIQSIIGNLQQIDFVKIFSVDNLINYVKGVFGVASTIFNIFVTIIMSVYILLEREEILKFIQKLNCAIYKKETSYKINNYIEKTNNIFLKFISSQILDGILVGIIVSIALSIMKVKYAILLGFLIGLFNIIPYFGAIIGVAIAGIITLFTGGVSQVIWMLIIVIILQQIDANIINPKIVGNALKVSPILVIFSVTIGGAYFGVLGMFLAVPLIALIKILINDYIESKENKEVTNKKSVKKV